MDDISEAIGTTISVEEGERKSISTSIPSGADVSDAYNANVELTPVTAGEDDAFLIESMSREGNPLDNSPDTLKLEVIGYPTDQTAST